MRRQHLLAALDMPQNLTAAIIVGLPSMSGDPALAAYGCDQSVQFGLFDLNDCADEPRVFPPKYA